MILGRLLRSFRQKMVVQPPKSCFYTSTVHRKTFRKMYQNFWKAINEDERQSPPWHHCVQLGDPVLRRLCTEVPLESIKDKEIKNLVEHMTRVLRAYNLVGISAPQIGVPVRIFLIEFNDKWIDNFPTEVYKNREMLIFPLTVFINPVIKVTNYAIKTHPEGCSSVCGYSADVNRYQEVLLSGCNESGEHKEFKLKGWNARIAQHEMDHLDGKMYTDIMDRKTFACSCWEAVNYHGGQLHIPYYPTKKSIFK